MTNSTLVFTSIARYTCPVCRAGFNQLAEKKAHVRREHAGLKKAVQA